MALQAIARVSAAAVGTGAVLYVLTSPTKTLFASQTSQQESSPSSPSSPELLPQPASHQSLPTRADQIRKLRKIREFDVLIVGGGAIACGIAVDAAARGLSTALVDIGDFGCGASTRGTKLLPATPRGYQEPMVAFHMKLFRGNKAMIEERSAMFNNAPHLCYRIPLVIPVYDWKKAIQMWIYFKTHWYVFRDPPLSKSQWVSKPKILQTFPLLKKENLRGAIIIHDALIDDIRMNITLVLTAARLGAVVANYVGVQKFIKDSLNRTVGAIVRDEVTGTAWTINAKCVINATGHNADKLRSMDGINAQPITNPILSTYLVLPKHYGHRSTGVMFTHRQGATETVILSTPFRVGNLVAGAHRKLEPTDTKIPSVRDISGLLRDWNDVTDSNLASAELNEVLSAWNTVTSVQVSHSGREKPMIDVSPTGMVSIAGGAWNEYRRLSEMVLDAAISSCKSLAPASPCTTKSLKLLGGAYWTPTLYIQLIKKYKLPTDTARHLANLYGDEAYHVARIAVNTWKGKSSQWPGQILVAGLPFIDAEVRHAVRHEYAITAVDVIARRLGVAFEDAYAAETMLPRVIEIMAEELGWKLEKREREYNVALRFLEEEMALSICRPHRKPLVIVLNKNEYSRLVRLFTFLDKDKDGLVSLKTLRPFILQERFHPEHVLGILMRCIVSIATVDDPMEYLRTEYYIPKLYRASFKSGYTKGIELYDQRMYDLAKSGNLNPTVLEAILTEMEDSTRGSMELGDFLIFMNNLKASLIRQKQVLKGRARLIQQQPLPSSPLPITQVDDDEPISEPDS